MSKYVQDIMDAMEKFAPTALKEDFDNVGLMVGDKNQKVNKILLALDCTMDVIDEAIEKGCNMIITHHPLIFRKPNRIVSGELIGDKIIKLIKNDIAVYSSHTNLDSVKGGINSTIVKMLGFNKSEIIDKFSEAESGIGRFVRLDTEILMTDLIKTIKKELQVENITGTICSEKVKNIAIINGSGTSYFDKAYRMGAECIITGDTSYHYISDYKELGVSIIDAGHFDTEWIIFIEVMKNIKDRFEEIEFIKSEKAINPITFL